MPKGRDRGLRKCFRFGILLGCAYLLVLFLFSPAFKHITFSAEDPLFYFLNRDSSFQHLLSCYSGLVSDWYRPTSFCLTYYVLMKFMGWHDLLALKLVNWIFFALELVGIFLLSEALSEKMELFSKGKKTRASWVAALSVLYFAALPLHHVPSYHVTAFEFLSQALAVFTVYFFVLALGYHQIHRSFWITSFVLYGISLTTKEPSVAIPAVLFVWAWIWQGVCGLKSKKRLKVSLQILMPFFVITLVYLVFRLSHVPNVESGGPYRLFSFWPKIRDNFWQLWNWSTWIFHKPFLHSDPYFPDPYFRAIGLGLLILCVAGFLKFRSFKGGKSLAIFLGAAFGIFAVIPINSGGYPWHFTPSAVFYALFFGYCAESAFDRVWLRDTALGFVFFVLLVTGYRGYHRFMRGPESYAMYSQVLAHPPIPQESIQGNTVIVVRNQENLPIWVLGVGHLFKYVYQKPDLIELNGPQMDLEAKKNFLNSRTAFCVDWDSVSKSWIDVTKECKRDFLRATQLRGH